MAWNEALSKIKAFGMTNQILTEDLHRIGVAYSVDLGHAPINTKVEDVYYPQFDAKLREEILLKPAKLRMPTRWESQGVSIYSGVVPVGQGVFHPIVIREGQVPYVEAMEAKAWTDHLYYEVCTHPAIYKAVERERSMATVSSQ